jgi:hypothetical protein
MDVETAAGIAGAGLTTIDANWGWAKGGLPSISDLREARFSAGRRALVAARAFVHGHTT